MTSFSFAQTNNWAAPNSRLCVCSSSSISLLTSVLFYMHVSCFWERGRSLQNLKAYRWGQQEAQSWSPQLSLRLHLPASHLLQKWMAFIHLFWGQHQVGSLTGAVHLSKCNTGVLRQAQGGQKPPLEQKGKSLLDLLIYLAVFVFKLKNWFFMIKWHFLPPWGKQKGAYEEEGEQLFTWCDSHI